MSIYDKASLVLIPSGTKTSKVYSQKPVNGDGDFTFSRSTAATRVNADGNIEKETQNLLLQSNNFDTTWTIGGAASVTGGQAGYDGTNNAWTLAKTAGWSSVLQNIVQTGVRTFSVYAKANASDWALLVINESGTDPVAYFDLANGVLGTTGTEINSEIESVGNGWYRISITYVGTISAVRIYPAEANTGGAASGSIYIQDAQLEQGLVARDYIETTTAAVEGGITDNVPRLDYTDSSCPALLLEPQRTNTLSQSEYFGGTHWTLGGIATIDTNSVNSPEGIQNATKLKASSSASTHSQIENNGGGSKSFTIFAKAGEENQIMIYGSTAGIAEGIVFDLSDGSFVKYWNNNSDHIDSYSSTDYGNGWYRYNINFDAITNIRLFIAKNDAITFSQTSGNGIYIYGAQFEDASYATSYIPTYGTSVTRNNDGYNNTTGISSLLGGTTGTFFVDMERFNIEDRDSAGGTFELRSSNGQTELNIDIEANGSTRAFYRDGGSFNFIYQSSVLRGKFCFVYNGANLKLYHNGIKQFDSNVLSLQDFSELIYTGVDGAKKHHQIMLFPTPLTDQEAIDLTTI